MRPPRPPEELETQETQLPAPGPPSQHSAMLCRVTVILPLVHAHPTAFCLTLDSCGGPGVLGTQPPRGTGRPRALSGCPA